MTQARVGFSRPYYIASVAICLLTILATAVGLFVPGFYRDAAPLLPQVYGQDLLTLAVAVPVYVAALYFVSNGSLRGYLVWLGVTGYLLYTYASYSFMTAFNELYLVYTTLLWLTLFTFVGGMARLDAEGVRRAIGDRPVWPYVAFQVLVVVLIASVWLSEILPATLAGTTPPSVAEAGLPTSVIYSFDLGIILPAFALSSYLLWQRRAWGYAFTAVLLVKVATLGGAVLAMAWFMIQDGELVPIPQIVIFGVLTFLALVLMVMLLLSIGRPAEYEDGTQGALS